MGFDVDMFGSGTTHFPSGESNARVVVFVHGAWLADMMSPLVQDAADENHLVGSFSEGVVLGLLSGLGHDSLELGCSGDWSAVQVDSVASDGFLVDDKLIACIFVACFCRQCVCEMLDFLSTL